MSEYTATRILEFDAGHRVLGHGGKCRHLHGHRFKVELTVTPRGTLDALGMVMDFSVLKSVVGKWIDDNLDHNFICHADDPLLQLEVNDPDDTNQVFAGKDPFVMPGGVNPTAENIAKLLYLKSISLLIDYPINVVRVRLWETPACYADYPQL